MPMLHSKAAHSALKDPTPVDETDEDKGRNPGVCFNCTRLRENP